MIDVHKSIDDDLRWLTETVYSSRSRKGLIVASKVG
jgi:hypothetical protein